MHYVTQSCPTLCDPMDCSPPGSSIHGILEAKYWSGLPCPPPGDLPNPGMEPRFPTLQVDLCCLSQYMYTHTHTHIYIMLYF